MGEELRRFSLGKDFMNYQVNDLLYGFLRGLSTAVPVMDEEGQPVEIDGIPQYKEYLVKKDYTKNKKVIAGVLSCSERTIERHLTSLIEAGLVEKGIVKIKRTDKECYYFPHNNRYPYKLIEKDLIKYLVATRSAHSIKIYLYLRNKYDWKKDYLFTIGEISQALGYAESTTSSYEAIEAVLDSFHREGMIKTEEVKILNPEKNIYLPHRKLVFVATSIKQLPQVN